MPELVKHFKEFFNNINKDEKIVYILNNEVDSYYVVDDIRIDPEGDVVIDISLSG